MSIVSCFCQISNKTFKGACALFRSAKMSTHKSEHLKYMAVISIVMVLLVIGSEVYLSLTAYGLVKDTKKLWGDFQEEVYSRSQVVDDLHAALGYGGIIHNFKNYVLRNDPQYRESFEKGLADVRKSIQEYLRKESVSEEERQNFSTIMNTFGQYEANLPVVAKSHEEGLSIRDIDGRVRVYDANAVQALDNLKRLRDQRYASFFHMQGMFHHRADDILILQFLILPVVFLVGFLLILFVWRLIRETASRESAEVEGEVYRKRLEATLNNIHDAFVTADEFGIIEDFNPASEIIFGYRKDEVLGKNVSFLMSGEYKKQHDEYLSHYRDTHEKNLLIRPRELEAKRKDGTVFPMNISLSEIEVEGKSFFVAIIRDLTEEKKSAEALRRKEKTESLGVMAGGLAHEINNALQPVLGLSEAMRDRFAGEDEKVAKCMSSIYDNTMHARNIVRDILAFARQEKKEKQQINLCDLIEECLSFAEEFISPDVTVEVFPYEKRKEHPMYAHIDRTGMAQILSNLFRNASDAMNGVGTITLSCDRVFIDRGEALGLDLREGEYARMRVSDNGSGMNEETLERIFDPFFTTKPFGKGTGLGLSAIYGIVQDWGGTVTVESELGKGTAFDIYIPLLKNADGEGGAPQQTKGKQDGEDTGD